MKRNDYIGFVKNITTEQSKTYITLVLNYEELEVNYLQIGEFVKLDSGITINKNCKNYLGRLEKTYYKPIEIKDYERSLALSKLNNEPMDMNTIKYVNFLHYDICILGEIEKNDVGKFIYYPSTRQVPSLIDIGIRTLSNDELKEVVNLSISNDYTDMNNEFSIGNLQYGSNPNADMKDIEKYIDINNFIKKRTANFGKTGFGKSNENKVLVSLLANKFKNLSMVIFDVNGEYAFSENDSTSKGLYETFKDIGIDDKLRVYTNRDISSLNIDQKDTEIINPFKMNFYESPETAISMLFHKRKTENGTIPQYIEDIYNNIDDLEKNPNKKAYVFSAFRKAGLKAKNDLTVYYGNKPYKLEDEYNKYNSSDTNSLFHIMEKSIEEKEKKDNTPSTTRELFKRYATLSFLNRFHSTTATENIFKSIITDIQKNKIVILDLISIDPTIIPMVSERIANTIFIKEQNLFAEGKCIDTILLIEEAHNLLSDNKGIWYRLAKEGRKYGIGMLYSTQSPKTIPNEILSQTENFFIKHLSSSEDVKALERAKVQFSAPISDFILNEPVVGLSYVYMEPYQPYVIPVKIKLLDQIIKDIVEK